MRKVVLGETKLLDSFGEWRGFGIASFVDSANHAHQRIKRDASDESSVFDDYGYGYSTRPDPLRHSGESLCLGLPTIFFFFF